MKTSNIKKKKLLLLAAVPFLVTTSFGVKQPETQTSLTKDALLLEEFVKEHPKATLLTDIQEEPDISIFVQYLKDSGVASLLSSGSYTILAPTDKSISKLSRATRRLIEENKGLMKYVVQQQIFPVKLTLADIKKRIAKKSKKHYFQATTLNKTTIEVELPRKKPVFYDSKRIRAIEPEIPVSDSILYIVDGFLFPVDIASYMMHGDPKVLEILGISPTSPAVEVITTPSHPVPSAPPLPPVKEPSNIPTPPPPPPVKGPSHIPPAQQLPSKPLPQVKSLSEILVEYPEGSEFLKLIGVAGLSELLTGTASYTIFVPTNEIFKKLPGEFIKTLEDPAEKAVLTEFVKTYFVPSSVTTKHVLTSIGPAQPRLSYDDLGGSTLLLGSKGKTLRITLDGKSALAVGSESVASNGVVHFIDNVLLPQNLQTQFASILSLPVPSVTSSQETTVRAKENIIDVLKSKPELSDFLSLLTESGLTAKFEKGGPYTVLAPSNSAMTQLTPESINIIKSHPELLKKFVQDNILSGKYDVADLKKMMASARGTLSGITNENEVQLALVQSKGEMAFKHSKMTTIIESDLVASNGFVDITNMPIVTVDTLSDPLLKKITVLKEQTAPGDIGPESLIAKTESNPEISKFVDLLKLSGLDVTLKLKTSHTVLALKNGIFDSLPIATQKALEDPIIAKRFLEHYIVKGNLTKNEVEVKTKEHGKPFYQTETIGKDLISFAVKKGQLGVFAVGKIVSPVETFTATNGVLYIFDNIILSPEDIALIIHP